MKNRQIITIAAFVLIIGGTGFYGGVRYQKSKTPEFARNMPENMGQVRGQMGQHRPNGGSDLTSVRGEIIDIDKSSITVKLTDDSSKIVIFSDSTGINKTEEGSTDDLSEGTQVMVMGQTNSDGSVTAQNIQIGMGMFTGAVEHRE